MLLGAHIPVSWLGIAICWWFRQQCRSSPKAALMTTTIDLDHSGMRLRIAVTPEAGPLRRSTFSAGLAGMMPLAEALKVLLGVIVAALNVVYLIGVFAA
jgi:hypothetical protein